MNGNIVFRLTFLSSALMFCTMVLCAQDLPGRLDIERIERLEVQFPDSAYNVLKNRLSKALASNNKLLEAFCLEYMGQVLYHMGDYGQAITNLHNAEKIFRDKKESRSLAKTLNYLGNVYYYHGQPFFALSMHREALSLYDRNHDHKGLTETLGQIGFVYEKQHKKDSAFYFQRLALREPINSADSLVKAKIFENIGSLMEDENRFDSALLCFREALRLNRKFNDPIAQIEILNNIGDICRKTGRMPEAFSFTRQAMWLAEKMQEKYQLQSACWDMARTFKILKHYDSALYYTEASKTLQHKIYKAENSKQTAFMHALFDLERKTAEIATLNGAQRGTTALSIAALCVCVLLALSGWIVISRQQLKIKSKQLEEANLKNQLELKSKGLSSHILHLIQKNELLETLKTDLTEMTRNEQRDQKKQLRQVLQKINISFSQDTYWEEFRNIFDQVHQSFFNDLRSKAANLSASELKLLSLIKMNLSSQEISILLGITPDSLRVIRYRIKKKLNIKGEESLTSFIQSL